MKNYLVLIAVALLVSACGGGSDSSTAPAVGSNGGITANVFSDAFTSLVFGISGPQPDTGEPVAVDAFVVSTPENTEPTPII